MGFTFFLAQFIMGLSSGMLLFLIASGLTLIFGLLRVPNFAHGSLYMMGAYLTYYFLFYVGQFGFFAALTAATISLAIIGALLEFFPLRRIYNRSHDLQLLMTFCFILLMEDVAKFIWGTSFKSIKTPDALAGSVLLPGGREFPIYCLFIIVCGFIVAIFLGILMNKTRLGKMIQAGTSNKEMLGALGINVPRMFTLVFMLGSALAGLAGGLAGPLIAVTVGMGDAIIIIVFAIIIVGGVGSLMGAFLCSILVGLLNTFGVYFMPGFAMIFTYMLVVIILLTKPEGIFGKREGIS